jgi:hypothetical protein
MTSSRCAVREPLADPVILGLGLVDALGVAGTGMRAVDWGDEHPDPLQSPLGFRHVFDRLDPTYRRIDRISRALVLAVEAAGTSRILDEHARVETALILETVRGCLESDLQFARGLRDGVVLGPVFPYTLPSTCLGEVALRHGLCGPTLCLSTDPASTGAALWEARALLEAGEAQYVLAASAEVLAIERAGIPAALAVVAVLIGRAGSGPTLTPWPLPGADPFGITAEMLLGPRISGPRTNSD